MANFVRRLLQGKRLSILVSLLALAFSLFGLVISFFNLFLSYFYVDDEVLARITDIAFDPAAADPASNYSKNGFVVLRVAFTNVGNRQAVINLPTYDLGIPQPEADEPQGFGGRVATPEYTFPFVLPPKEIRIVPLSIPVSCMLAGFQRGLPMPSSGREAEGRRFDVGLTYGAVDSSGQPHTAWSGRQVYVNVTPSAFDGYGPVDSEISPSTATLKATRLFDSNTIQRPRRSIILFQPPEPSCEDLLG
jgi:hypothetical protein